MDSSLSTPKSKKTNKDTFETPAKKQIRLPYNENAQFVSADQLTKIPKREDDEFLAGDLVWVKNKGFPWWACMITVDPETGKYSKTVVIRDKNNKAFHVQFFGKNAYRGYTQGNIMKYEGKEKYELKLDQIKNTPTPNKSQRKMELNNYEIKHTFKKDWNLACIQADEAMKLDRAIRIETLTFEYIVERPKSGKKKLTSSDDEENEEVKRSVKSSAKKRKTENQLTSSKSTKSTAKKKKKISKANSGPADVYDFNEFDDEFEENIVTPKKPFQLSSAKRAKGEFLIYAKQLRQDIQKENPELDDDEIETKLKRNWELMSEDMRNSYAPRPSLFQNGNLSFQLDSPSKSFNKSLNEADISLPDLNSSMVTDQKQPVKTYSGLKRGRKPKTDNEKSKKNGYDFEKENAVEMTDEMNNREEENSIIESLEDDKVSSSNRRSSRKKLFKQGNETVNSNGKEDSSEDNKNATPKKRRSVRASTGKVLKSDVSTIKETATNNSTETDENADESTISNKTPSKKSSRKSSRQSTKSTNSIKVNDENESFKNDQDEISEEKQKLTVTEENGVGSEDSFSSESEKTTEHQKNEENKEKHCAKCYQVDRGLIKCDGDCLEYYHPECLHQE